MFGLSDSWLLHEGKVVPSVAVLSHVEQRDRLRRYCPEAVDAALVAGDPCFDRMLASVPLRETYRRHLNARAEQRVVTVSSTWGNNSLFGQHPELIPRLAQQLPLDEYRVLVALHPNIWHGHTAWQVRMWLKDCVRAGVVVLPPEEGWRAALVASDLTIGDHGSVTFYSAALGTPVLLASWPEDSVDPASPIAALLRAAPKLDPRKPLAEQIDSTLAAHSTGRYAAVTDLLTSAPGESARLLREAVYRHLRLAEPSVPAEPVAVPLPAADIPRVPSQLVRTALTIEADSVTANVLRLPAEALRDPAHRHAESVLVASTEEPSRGWLETAEILVHDEDCADPHQWIENSLVKLPGCLLAATRQGPCWLIGSRDFPLVRCTGPGDLGAVYAALVHAWLRDGHPPEQFPQSIRLRLGTRTETVYTETLSD